MEPYETFEHHGLTVELHQDYDAGNPFTEMDQAAELVWANEREMPYDSKDETIDMDRFSSVAHAQRYLTLFDGALAAIPFRIDDYGSGGMRARLMEAPWDERDRDFITGFVIVTQRGVDVTGCPDPEEAARQDFETFRQWVEGEVSGFVVKGPEGEHLDSCWGFYGDPNEENGCKDEAKSMAEWHAKQIALDVEPPDVAEVLAGMR